MSITALPTTYAGINFRSRLEADWAATLDDREIHWQYEPEGYLLTDGTKYLPDFYLPNVRGWLEIKGDHMERISKVEQFATDLWHQSGASTPYDPTSPLILTGLSPTRQQRRGGTRYRASLVAFMGTGRTTQDVGFTFCYICESSTIFIFGQTFCRSCAAEGGEVLRDELLGMWIEAEYSNRSFIRVPRPFHLPQALTA